MIILNNPIDSNLPPNPAAPLFRAGDKISSSKAIAMTFAGWASGSATLLAGANEIFDTVSWGTDYRIPVGEDIPDTTDFQMFEYTGAAIMAGEGGASVQIDANADGIFENTVQLAEGQSHLINGGLSVGGRFLSSEPVQVDLMTGDRQDGYESRFCRLLPTSLWASSYYTPVSTPSAAQGNSGSSTSVWLYNPGASAIGVTYQRRGAANLTSDLANKAVAYGSQPLSGSAPGNVYGPMVELNSDGTFTGTTPEGAWIGVVDRSASNSPTVESKVANAQAAGAAAVIVVRNAGGTTFPTESAGSPVIPVIGMTQNGGTAMRAAGLGAGWVRVSGDQVGGTINVPAGSYINQVLTDGYGARFFTTDGQPFYALSTTDSGGTTLSDNTAGSNRTWDWGFTLVPESSLTPQVLIGLGIGRDPTSAVNPNENGNPVWITTTGNGNTNAAVFVDFDSDPTTGPLTDANGNRYDLALTLREYETAKIYNPSGNQTGMLLYTLDPGVKLAAAWGQDVLQSTGGQPGLDMGTGIPPLPQFVGAKKSLLFLDSDGDGYVSPGDVLEYVITITNISRVPVSDLEVEDVLPGSLTYQPGTTRFKNALGVESAIPDSATGSAFPLDGGGVVLSQSSLPPNGGTWELSYRAVVVPASSLPPEEFTIINSATIGGISVSDPIVLRETQRIYGQIGDRVWTDLNGNGLQDSGEPGIPGITAQLLDASNNVLNTAISDGNGWYRFLGVLPGNYRVGFSLPTGYNFSPSNADGTGLAGGANSDAAPLTGRTSLFNFTTGSHRLTVDAGLVPIVGPLGILKTSDVEGFANPGGVVEYTVVVTNSGITPQTQVAINDVLPAQTTLVPGSVQATLDPPLNPGGTFTVDFQSNGTFTVPEGVTGLTVEAWGGGGGGGKTSASNDNAGGGGGGGGYGRSDILVTPNSPLTVNVGTGGTAGNPGGDSWFGSATTVRGGGGSGGGATTTSGGAGGTSNLGNLATFNGGSGGTGHASGTDNNRRGGGGGGSATPSLDGGNGDNGGSNSGGTGGSGEAAGGNGRQGANNGLTGGSPGGGGGGGGRSAVGGSGGNGRVRVTYTVPAGVPGMLGAPPNLASGWTLPAGSSLTLKFQVTVNSPAAGTQIINTATATSNESPVPTSSTVFDTLAPGSISGFVLADTNNNGTGDTGLPGVVLALSDASGNPVLDGGGAPRTTTTGSDGSYAFANLTPGAYQISETQPSGYVSISDIDGGDPDVIGSTAAISVLSGQAVTGRNFIEIQLGSISGFVFAGSAPLAGVTLTLLDAVGDPVDGDPSTPGVQPLTTVTNSLGFYQFSAVMPGVYQVSQVQPARYDSFGDADGGDLDIIGDVTPIVLAPGGQSENNNFLETPDTCPNDWDEWKLLHPGEAPAGNPDADAHDNFAEFAFAMPYDAGTGSSWLGATAWVIQPSTLAPGTLEGVFVRPKGATANVTYTLQHAPVPGDPTVWQSVLVTPAMVSTVDNGDCTETVTIRDIETLTGLVGGEGVVRIRADLDDDGGGDGEIDHTSFTEVQGWTVTGLEICCRTYNNPYQRESVFTGTVTAVNAQNLAFAANDELDDLLSAGGSFYLEVTSGDFEGQRFDIVSAAGNTVTLANDGDPHAAVAPFNTRVGPPPAGLTGDRVAIRRHWTLEETFPPSGLGASGSQSSADQVQIYAGGAWAIYWLFDGNDGIPPAARWVDAADAGMADRGGVVIPPGQGAFFNNRTAISSILAYGEIRANDFVRPHAPGNNLVGGGYPLDQSANAPRGRAMNPTNGFFGSTSFKTADSIFVWRADTVIEAPGYDTYYLLGGVPSQPALTRWVKVGDASILSRDAETIFSGNRSVITRSAGAVPAHTVPKPWTP